MGLARAPADSSFRTLAQRNQADDLALSVQNCSYQFVILTLLDTRNLHKLNGSWVLPQFAKKAAARRHFGRGRQARFDKADEAALTFTQQNQGPNNRGFLPDTNVSLGRLIVAILRNFAARNCCKGRRYPQSPVQPLCTVPGLG